MKPMKTRLLLTAASLVVWINFCGGSTSQVDAGADGGGVCLPGASIACVGVGGCSGGQVCNSSGSAYGPCDCGQGDASANDASNDAQTADADAGSWSPKQLPGLVLWLDDTVGVAFDSSGFVHLWSDQSGFGNDAQPSATNRPSFVMNAINKHPAARMTNNCPLLIVDSPSLHFGTAPFAIYVIGLIAGGGSGVTQTVWNKFTTTTGLNWTAGGSPNGLLATSHTASVQFVNADTSAYHKYVLTGPALALSIDSVTVDGGTATDDLGGNGQSITLGAGASGEVDLAELVAVTGTISPGDQGLLASYFSAKFGL